MRQLKSGAGWRLGWDAEASFQGLVGNDDWAIELTEAELKDFCKLALQLSDTMQQMRAELMDQERISCEAETALIWLEVEGLPDAYQLRFLLLTGRRAEGEWPASAVPGLLAAAQTLTVF